MKFGKVLQQSIQMSSKEWEPHWLDYKLLKNIIKDCAMIQKEEKLEGLKRVKKKIKPSAKEDNDSIRQSPHEENFFRTLRMEMKKIVNFFVKEQLNHSARVNAIEQSFTTLKSDPKCEIKKTEVMKSCVTLYKELLLLENYAVMNFCGVSKILKKHDKWTGYVTRQKFMHTILMKAPFATYRPLLKMINRLEQIFIAATGSTIDQHESHVPPGYSAMATTPSYKQLHEQSASIKSNVQLQDSSVQLQSVEISADTPKSPPSAEVQDSKKRKAVVMESESEDQDDDSEKKSIEKKLITSNRTAAKSYNTVQLVDVQALRGDAKHMKKLESEGVETDFDGENENTKEWTGDEQDDANDAIAIAMLSMKRSHSPGSFILERGDYVDSSSSESETVEETSTRRSTRRASTPALPDPVDSSAASNATPANTSTGKKMCVTQILN